MSIKAGIYHLTHYRYDRPVTLGPQIIRLRPAPHSRTRVISHSLRVSPPNHFVNHQQDPYGNWLARFVFPEPVNELKIEVGLVAQIAGHANPTVTLGHYTQAVRDGGAAIRLASTIAIRMVRIISSPQCRPFDRPWRFAAGSRPSQPRPCTMKAARPCQT